MEIKKILLCCSTDHCIEFVHQFDDPSERLIGLRFPAVVVYEGDKYEHVECEFPTTQIYDKLADIQRYKNVEYIDADDVDFLKKEFNVNIEGLDDDEFSKLMESLITAQEEDYNMVDYNVVTIYRQSGPALDGIIKEEGENEYITGFEDEYKIKLEYKSSGYNIEKDEKYKNYTDKGF